jgi:hypothetical protein
VSRVIVTDIFSPVGSVDARIQATVARWIKWDGHRARRTQIVVRRGGKQAQGNKAEDEGQTWRCAGRAARRGKDQLGVKVAGERGERGRERAGLLIDDVEKQRLDEARAPWPKLAELNPNR